MPRRKNYYLLDMGEYEKVVNKWNKYGKQDDIITINRVIKDQVCMEDYIHRNKLASVFHIKKHQLNNIAVTTKDPIEKAVAEGMKKFILLMEEEICGKRGGKYE